MRMGKFEREDWVGKGKLGFGEKRVRVNNLGFEGQGRERRRRDVNVFSNAQTNPAMIAIPFLQILIFHLALCFVIFQFLLSHLYLP